MSEITPNIGLTLPTIFGDNSTWGNELNENFRLIDTAIANAGSSATQITIPKDSGTINVTPTQAKATIIILVDGAFPSNFTVVMPAGPKAPFIIINSSTANATIQSVAAVNSIPLPSFQTGFFFQDANDIAIYGLSAAVNGVPVSGPVMDLNSNTIVTQVDQGGGSVQLQKAGGTGGNMVDFPALTGSVSSLRNKTLLIYVPSGMTMAWAGFKVNGIGFRVVVKTGILTIGHARIFTTGELDMTVSGRSGLVAFNGVTSNIDIDATGGIIFQTCDNLSITNIDISNGGDWYLAIYFANVANNDTVTVGQATGGVQVPEALVSGDLVNTNVGALLNGGIPVTSYASHTLVTWVEDTGI